MLKIFNENEEQEPVIYLRIVPHGSEAFIIQAVDSSGERLPKGDLLAISAEGVSFPVCVNPKFGIALRERGKLEIIE